MERKWVITGLILIILAIILGAFGAHGLKTLLQYHEVFGAFDAAEKRRDILASFDTATKYQFFQGLGFLVIPFMNTRFQVQSKTIFLLMVLGTIFFSGSIYGLTVSKIHGLESLKRILGPVTPIGGVLMILAWFFLLIRVIRYRLP
ncbi:DUF423 domain-containing protein [Fluviicola sp.]|jgi:uncharacterized membrane protein YgdD (TMEM256/DUF423 family)|uniref:DUF423 domain-containing protein n=1 Tax=Fluviicola sp. TaxID=1917219 RepID=UPI0028310630|nr:DUF423 domain-containing protein [Fluviicola sp.]MDR0801245.1 DUF423 domain-containing protein [Fluviicola sp.]